MHKLSIPIAAALAAIAVTEIGFGQSLPAGIKAKVEAKVKQLQPWSTDPTIVAAVKAHNSNPPAEAKAMTNAKWSELTVVDPFVRSFSKNSLGTYLKTKKNDQIAECFVSGADGTKVAFLSKTTSWSHADKDKHKLPMAGRVFIGPMAVDESTGVQMVQIGLPVLHGAKPIGSIVIGVAVSKLE